MSCRVRCRYVWLLRFRLGALQPYRWGALQARLRGRGNGIYGRRWGFWVRRWCFCDLRALALDVRAVGGVSELKGG